MFQVELTLWIYWMFSWHIIQKFLETFFTLPVAPIITGTIKHFIFHIGCISIQKLLYFHLFSFSFCARFLSAGIATSISTHFFFFVFNYIWAMCLDSIVMSHFHVHILVGVWLSFLPGTSLEPAVIPTAHASSFTLQYFPYYVWCSKYSCLL